MRREGKRVVRKKKEKKKKKKRGGGEEEDGKNSFSIRVSFSIFNVMMSLYW